ncbi:2-methylcitrate dehydratase [Polychaeton citri CBS 116435]|uniref:2-methylcitrate dehydratase n=1 Tax=Polychaeton citri CBS 116435 TaxID=1314669 RepID=A0A9P4UPW7_9PEZI|nr:2-methylcitrate dehydratase [Polychaeton citri CBS 116435]
MSALSVSRHALRNSSRSLSAQAVAARSAPLCSSSVRQLSSNSCFSTTLAPTSSVLARNTISRQNRAFSSTPVAMSPEPAKPASANAFDPEISAMAEYIHNYNLDSDLAIDTARLVFLDTLGCGLKALEFPQCKKLLGPVVPGTVVPNGTRVPGTPYVLDPVLGAFNIGAMIRWLDFNDCWLAAEWGHPSDNLGAILSVADWMTRTNKAGGDKIGNGKTFTVKDVLEGMVKAHEIQGCMALENSFNKVGLDHVVLVKVASTAVVSKMLGLNEAQTRDAISQAWVDGQSMRTYRHSPNTMSRKSWAAGDACEKAVNLCLKVMKGEGGLPTVLSVPTWGFYDVNFGKKPFTFQRPYGSYVMENVLFKVSYPAEFHSQTAIEAAKRLNVKLRSLGKTAEDIEEVTNRTHEACVRIIDKQFKPMDNFADRDHCVQYMVSTMFVFDRLEAGDYADDSEAAQSPLVESLRQRIKCVEDPQFTADYHDPEKRTISNALTVKLKDGTVLEEEVVEAPLGHRLRRDEAKPEIMSKYERHIGPHFSPEHVKKLVELGNDAEKLYATPVDEYVDLYVTKKVL